MTESTNCSDFRGQIHHYQAGELSAADRVRFEAHRDGCADCSERLRVEGLFLDALREKLPRAPAPLGLATRVRAALNDQPAEPAPQVGWFRSPWAALAAAALLMMALLLPGVTGGPAGSPSSGPAAHVHVDEEVLVIDQDCAAAGYSIDQQRRCRHPLHVNALQTANGEVWNLAGRQAVYRQLLLDPAERGRRLRVSGDLYPDLATVRIDRIEPLSDNQL